MTVSSELRDMLPTWAVAILLPLPVATFWQDGSGRAFAYVYLFIGCAVLTAERFGRSPQIEAANQATEGMRRRWRVKMAALVLAMAGAVSIFTAFGWAMSGQLDSVIPLLAVLAVLPALGCVPLLALITGKPYAAVLFTAFLLGLVKIAGCVVVRIVYGPNALAEGHMTLPWEQPNLLVWLCLAGAVGFSVVFYPMGRRTFIECGNRTTSSDPLKGPAPPSLSRG